MDFDAHVIKTNRRLDMLESGGVHVAPEQSLMKDEAVQSAITAYREAAERFEEQRALMAGFMEKWEPLLQQLQVARDEFDREQERLAAAKAEQERLAAEQEAADAKSSEDATDENNGSGEADDDVEEEKEDRSSKKSRRGK